MTAKLCDRLSFESELWHRGLTRVAGVDEAGRGPLAGPVVAAAVILPQVWQYGGFDERLRDLNDSKQLAEAQREAFFAILTAHPEIRHGIATVDAAVIDRNNILQATHRAMNEALAQLQPPPIPPHTAWPLCMPASLASVKGLPPGSRRHKALENLWHVARLCSFLFTFAVSGLAAEKVAKDSAPRPPQVLGIFGGMGPEATANLYQEIVKLTPAQRDQDHIPTLIYSLPQVPDRTTAIKNHDRSIVPHLVEGVTRLEKGGASFIVIPCNTAHYFYDDMQRAVKIPIVHMIREAVRAVDSRHPDCKRVGLLATDGTIASGLYEKEFRARGLEVVCPDAEIQSNCVMKAVYGIKAGADKQASEDLLFTAGRSLEAKGAQVIVLGCTEIPLAFNPGRASVPVVNATRVLAEAAIRCFHRGPRVVSGSERTVTEVFVVRIVNCTAKTVKRARLTVHAPAELPQQTIRALEAEGSPVRKADRWNSPVLVYERAKLAPGESLVGRWTATATIRELQWDLPEGADADGAGLPVEETALYLRDLKYLALKDSGIRTAFDEATRDRHGPRARLEGIFDLVMKRLTYDRDEKWDPAPQVLATGKGSCSEYTYCFMALCRAGGIPARYVGGPTGREEVPFFLDTVFHRYPQAYVPGAGWVDFDPTRNERAKDPRRFFGCTSRLMLLTCVGDGGDGSLTGWDYLESHQWDGAKTNAARIRAGWWFASPPPPEVQQRTEAFRKRLSGGAAADRRGLVDEALAIGHPFVLPWLDDLLYEPAARVAAAKACCAVSWTASAVFPTPRVTARSASCSTPSPARASVRTGRNGRSG